MKPGKSRFKIQLNKIEALINQANSNENPALWLFLHDMRTPLFMLEGLSKLYAELNSKNSNGKTFLKLKNDFKILEDVLGSIDYYASFQKEFIAYPKIPAAINDYFVRKTDEKIHILNQLLKKENWLDGKLIKKITKKLDDLDWDNEEDEIGKISKFYQKQFKKLNDFVSGYNYVFESLEDGVHELRRRLRWLSIYPQALNGSIQLKEIKPKPKHLAKYLTPEIVNSRFNVMPNNSAFSFFIEFDKNKFLALSWMISELGNLKDKGLRIKALKDAFQATLFIKDAESYQEAYKLLGENYPQIDQILLDGSKITKVYFEEQNLSFVL